ncbi:MAG: siderophore-interacting protein [Pseudomonadota bacterium]
MIKSILPRKGGRFAGASVVRAEPLSPHMVRLTFKSDLAAGFAPDSSGGHIKLVLPKPGESGLPDTSMADFKTRMRTYTLRHVRPEQGEFDIDFVIHGDEGVAGPWAANAQPGDVIAVSPPGMPKLITSNADWFLVAADMSAIPAAAAGLESLHASAVGEVFFEIMSEDDRQPVAAPAGVSIHWIVPDEGGPQSEKLIDAVRNLCWREGDPSVFVAGEFSTVGTLRAYFRHERQTAKSLTYISSYWKHGLIEPEHKVAKAKAA